MRRRLLPFMNVSLGIKITIFVVGSFLFAGYLLGEYMAGNIEQQAVDVGRSYATGIPDIVDSSIESFMLKGHTEMVGDVLTRLSKQPYIIGVHMFDTDSNMFLIGADVQNRYPISYLNSIRNELSFDEKYVVIRQDDGMHFVAYYRPYINGPSCWQCHGTLSRYVGILNVNVDITGFVEKSRGDAMNVRILLYAVTIAVGIALVITLRYTVLRPINGLVQAMHEVAEHQNLDVSYEYRSGDEFEQLSRYFNIMILSMKRSMGVVNSVHHGALHGDRLITIGQLSATISHEIKNPLNSIMLAGDLLIAKHPECTALAERIIIDAEKIQKIIDQTLRFAKMQPPEEEDLEMREVLEDIRLYAKKILLDKEKVKFVVENDIALPSLRANRVHLEQVIINLLKNAAEAMESPGTITLSMHTVGEQFVITVADTGPGVPQGMRETIFNEYYTSKPNGTGLGLSIVRYLVELHGGHLTLTDTPGGGATFTITLPLSRRTENA